MRTNYKILIIDDNLIDQIISKKLLKKNLGITKISTANNGKGSPEESLIILLDINMPEMDGFEFLSVYEMFSEELKKGTQIFMLSSTLDLNDIKQAKNNKNVKMLLSKPLSISEFVYLI